MGSNVQMNSREPMKLSVDFPSCTNMLCLDTSISQVLGRAVDSSLMVNHCEHKYPSRTKRHKKMSRDRYKETPFMNHEYSNHQCDVDGSYPVYHHAVLKHSGW